MSGDELIGVCWMIFKNCGMPDSAASWRAFSCPSVDAARYEAERWARMEAPLDLLEPW